MKVHVLHQSQVLPYPLQDLFRYFEKPENLALITPPGLAFRILTPAPIVMKVGTLIDYTIRVSGVRLRWTTLITTYNPPHEFVDEQLRGPYALWFHRHRFAAVPGGTEMIDSVHYALPLGPLGELAHLLFVKRQVRDLRLPHERASRRSGESFAGEHEPHLNDVRERCRCTRARIGTTAFHPSGATACSARRGRARASRWATASYSCRPCRSGLSVSANACV